MEGFQKHPVYESYAAHTDGRVMNIVSSKPIKACISNNGYTFMNLTNDHKHYRQYVHRFVWECYNGIIPEKHHIDHIDSIKTNNSLINLQCLSPKDHAKKTSNDNPFSYIKTNHKIARPILCEKDGIITEFASVPIAAMSTCVIRDTKHRYDITKNISEACKFNRPYNGYIWKFKPDEIAGEYWVCPIYPEYRGIQVSNMGRLMKKQGRATYGNDSGGYKVITHKKRRVSVHIIVARTFIGEAPTSKHTVDHINRVRHDNRFENLRWANPYEQSLNRYTVVGVTAYNIDASFYKTYASANIAAEDVGLANGSHIIQACRGKVGLRANFYWTYANAEKPTVQDIQDVLRKEPRGVNAYDLTTKTLFKSYRSAIEAAKEFNSLPGNIYAVCNGYRNHHKGYLWKYMD